MRLSPRLLLIPAGLLLVAAAWLWWNRPQRIDIATYAPADSIIYLEADDIPAILAALTTTDAWRELAPAAGLRTDLGRVGWLGRLSAWTGVGTAESVVLSRAQVAVVVLGFETEGEAGGEAVVRPRLALVAETHTGHSRTRDAVIKFAGDFARSTYGGTRLERTERDGLTLLNWSQVNGTRGLRAAVSDGYAVVGTDEAAVEACLAVRRGERPAIAADARLAEMRERVGAHEGGGALAFGYVPRQAAPRLSEIAALFLASRMPLDAAEQSGAAIILPQLAARLLGGAAWGFHVNEGGSDDRYFLELGGGVAPRLAAALESPREPPSDLAPLVPSDARQFTRYNFAEPIEAWRGLNAVISSQVDFTIAPVVVRLLDQQLLPYGIESPRDFLRAVGPEVATARLDAEGERMALVAAARDEAALRALVRKRFGNARPTKIGDAEFFADEEEETAFAFAGGHVITGDAESVRRGLQARAAGRTLDTVEAFKLSTRGASAAAPPHVLTLADDREATRAFVAFVARQRGARQRAPDAAALDKALASLAFASTETRLVADGFERRTRSAFGQFGSLILRFTAAAETRQPKE